ncbi:MAG: hypothetical protein AVDCRST_MAG13-2419, partial [uncultured Solirubrobacteraceae bacterium]
DGAARPRKRWADAHHPGPAGGRRARRVGVLPRAPGLRARARGAGLRDPRPRRRDAAPLGGDGRILARPGGPRRAPRAVRRRVVPGGYRELPHRGGRRRRPLGRAASRRRPASHRAGRCGGHGPWHARGPRPGRRRQPADLLPAHGRPAAGL